MLVLWIKSAQHISGGVAFISFLKRRSEKKFGKPWMKLSTIFFNLKSLIKIAAKHWIKLSINT